MEQLAFPRYDAYKPSGADWLGKIPADWPIQRLGAVFEERKEKVSDKDFPPLSVTKNGILPQLDSAAKSDDGDNRKGVRTGDFVINSRSDRKGSSGIAEQDGSVSLINIVLKPKGIDPRYCEHLLKSNGFVEEFYRNGHGIVADLWTTKYWNMKSILIPVPDMATQQRIANFLDQKTAEIDEAIAKKQRLIELLKEQKTILINQAVTKGLNPDAPMRDSGVEWIGEVPEHWEIKRLKHLIDFLPGFAFKSEQYSEDDTDVPLLRGININPGQLKWGEVVYWPKEKLRRYEQYQLCEGDYVIGMDRPWVSDGIRVARVGLVDLPCLLLQRVGCIRARQGLISDYMGLLLRSDAFLAYFEPMLSGISVPHISPEQIGNFSSAFPPESEQEEISRFAQRVEAEFDELVSKEMSVVRGIQEYRSVIIAEAVTGKIKL